MSILRTVIALATAACAALILIGCNDPIPRMDSNFNAQPVGAPQQFPTPNPPNDDFIWLIQKPVSSVVESNPGGGKWVRTKPLPAFIANPDLMHQFLLATSQPFTMNPPAEMNGEFSVRLLGPGKVNFGIRATRGTVGGFVGGGELSTSPSGGGGIGILLSPGVIDNLEAFSSRDFPVTGLTTYHPGQVVVFRYSIDQPSRTFNISVSGAGTTGSQSTTYNFPGAIQQLQLWLFLRQPASNTEVFVKDIKMNELK